MRSVLKNFLHNKKFRISGFIYDQNRGDVANMRFGLKPMSYNGCGIIALYNALLLLKKPSDIRNVAAYCEKHGKWLWGLWGTKPGVVRPFFRKKGFDVKKTKPKNADSGVYILLVWNKRGGMHYMSLNADEDKIEVFNGYRSGSHCDVYKNLDEFFKDTKTICVRLWKIVEKGSL